MIDKASIKQRYEKSDRLRAGKQKDASQGQGTARVFYYSRHVFRRDENRSRVMFELSNREIEVIQSFARVENRK